MQKIGTFSTAALPQNPVLADRCKACGERFQRRGRGPFESAAHPRFDSYFGGKEPPARDEPSGPRGSPRIIAPRHNTEARPRIAEMRSLIGVNCR